MNFRALLQVQAMDHRIVQLEYRRQQLPERAAADVAKKALDFARAQVKKNEKRQGDITGEINRLELRGKELDTKKMKYEAQLKSVIAMREVEALQHEIAGVNAEHSSLDDAELLLLDENETLDTALATSRDGMPHVESAANTAVAALGSAIAVLDADIAAAHAERSSLAALADADSMALYESVRARMSSAAVAEITKGSCGGCHTSMSPKEQAELKKVADTPDAVCPYCGCLLAV